MNVLRFTTTKPDAALPALATAVIRVARRALIELEQAWQTRTAAQQLGALDDRALADIGISRSGIDRAAGWGRSSRDDVSAARPAR
ncbi:DUF1127 domain-containing protein [Ancylobacter sonchi]|uniref:DUF1127 domain-containing protein n=1 Tax=Ancylobacter sonchi TaxID=1937790 RepID=UPI001BD2E2F3|nr:DUF1127 domain-containing protein [Ancylobacter sonchi]MBS7534535.1 DUF1127 domain-containing protein [Ancylobacter sonchi]